MSLLAKGDLSWVEMATSTPSYVYLFVYVLLMCIKAQSPENVEMCRPFISGPADASHLVPSPPLTCQVAPPPRTDRKLEPLLAFQNKSSECRDGTSVQETKKGTRLNGSDMVVDPPQMLIHTHVRKMIHSIPIMTSWRETIKIIP